jgi:hypothetical protein
MKIRRSFSLTILAVCGICLFAVACGSTTDNPNVLDRTRAAKMIAADPGFNKSTEVLLKAQNLLVDQTSHDDSPKAALQRGRQYFNGDNPALKAASELGLIKIDFDFVRLRPNELGMQYENYRQGFGRYEFAPKFAVTDKGKQSWQEIGLDPQSDRLPLARPKFDGVTGISEAGNAADVHFTWHRDITSYARALTLDSPEFKQLPADLQDIMRTHWAGAGAVPNGSPRAGIANFQKFDDGWRLKRVNF